MKYIVEGIISYNFAIEISAESKEEAEKMGEICAASGVTPKCAGLDCTEIMYLGVNTVAEI